MYWNSTRNKANSSGSKAYKFKSARNSSLKNKGSDPAAWIWHWCEYPRAERSRRERLQQSELDTQSVTRQHLPIRIPRWPSGAKESFKRFPSRSIKLWRHVRSLSEEETSRKPNRDNPNAQQRRKQKTLIAHRGVNRTRDKGHKVDHWNCLVPASQQKWEQNGYHCWPI